MRIARPTRLAPIVIVTLVLGACSAGAGTGETVSEPAEITINGSAMADADEMADTIEASGVAPASADPELRQRCIDGIRILERRWEDEDFEYPDEGPELSEEELEQTMAPPQDYDDRVAAPDERPTLSAVGAFEPETMPIPQLDRFRESCFEQGLVTEAELYGEDDDEGGEGDWCEELASFSDEDIREFAADDGEDIVRAEFEACGLPNPLDS